MAFHKLLTVTFALLAHSSLTDTEVVPRAVRGGFSSVELSTRATHSSWPVAPLPGGSRLRTISLLAREEPAGAEEDGHGRDHAEEGKSHEHKDDHKVTHNDGHKAHEEHSSQHDGHDDHGHQSHDDHGHHDSHGEHAHGGHEHHGDEDTLLHHNGEHVDEHLQEDAGCAHPVAVGLVAAVIMIPLMISMAMDPGVIGTLTYMLLDTFVSIFLAVLWFNAFSHLVEFFHRRGLDSYVSPDVVAVVQVCVLYVIAMVISYMWRNNEMRLLTFCSCGAHYIAFAGIYASGTTQHGVGKWAGEGIFGPLASFVCVFVTVIILSLVALFNYFSWRRYIGHSKLNEAVEDLEVDVMGLIASFLITQSVRHTLTGRYPPLHFLFLQNENEPLYNENNFIFKAHKNGDHHDHYVHTAWQRAFMLCWSISLSIISGLVLPHCKKSQDYYLWNKVMRITKVVLIMLVAWGYLLWGQWMFYETIFKGDLMFGHMVFASLATLCCLGVLFGLASIRVTTASSKETIHITITGVSLVAAWSWEHCFNIAIDVIGEDFQVGFGGLVPKFALAIVIPMVLLPTYLKHVKTRVIQGLHEEQEHERSMHLERHHPMARREERPSDLSVGSSHEAPEESASSAKQPAEATPATESQQSKPAA